MKFSIKTDQLDKQLSDVLVIGVYESLKVVCEKLSEKIPCCSEIYGLCT